MIMSEKTVLEGLIGTVVLVRDDKAGVHVGVLAECDIAAGWCALRNARKIWYWAGEGSDHVLAARGLRRDGSKIAPPVESVLTRAIVEIVQMTPAGAESVMGAPEWAP
jgi:hypothetical protein